jgi:hypothetical protein
MASWGSIPILSGFLYNGLTRELEIKPLAYPGNSHQENFRCFWSAPTGWGTFQLHRKNGRPSIQLEPVRGSLEIRSLRLALETFPVQNINAQNIKAQNINAKNIKMTLGDRSIPCSARADGKDAVITCNEGIRVSPANILMVSG